MACPYPHQQRIPQPQQAYTLVELLVVVVIGGVVLGGAIAMLLSHIRSSSQLAALLRLQDQCGRVQFLLNHEIQQASRADGGGNTLTLTVPGMSLPITYTTNGTELTRSGPSINQEGRLVDGDTAVESLVVRGVQAFNVNVANPRTPTYTLTVEDARGVSYTSGNAGDSGGAHCRVRDISDSNGS